MSSVRVHVQIVIRGSDRRNMIDCFWKLDNMHVLPAWVGHTISSGGGSSAGEYQQISKVYPHA